MTARRCHAITKGGKPCRAAPLTDGDFCLAHSDEQTRSSTNFQNGPRPGRPVAPRTVDVIREKIEAEADKWLNVLIEARDATKTVTVGYGDNAYQETVPDHQVRLAAFREAHDRAYGKPRQSTEVSGPDGAPLAAGFDPKLLSVDELRNVVSLVGRARGNGST